MIWYSISTYIWPHSNHTVHRPTDECPVTYGPGQMRIEYLLLHESRNTEGAPRICEYFKDTAIDKLINRVLDS